MADSDMLFSVVMVTSADVFCVESNSNFSDSCVIPWDTRCSMRLERRSDTALMEALTMDSWGFLPWLRWWAEVFAPGGGGGGMPLGGAAPMGVLDHWPAVCHAWVTGGGWWLGSIALFMRTWVWGALRL